MTDDIIRIRISTIDIDRQFRIVDVTNSDPGTLTADTL